MDAKDQDIVKVTYSADGGPDDRALRLEHAALAADRQALQLDACNEADAELRPPQPTRDELPDPSWDPLRHKGIVVEIGSGKAVLSQAIYVMSKHGVGCYTIDWDSSRNAHLCKDFRDVQAALLHDAFPHARHFHVTWDCKSYCRTG